MGCVNDAMDAAVRPVAETAQVAGSVDGLELWLALKAWRANWRPEPEPARSVEELSVIFLSTLRMGYAAYAAGARRMPELFARDSALARMWQQGFAMAREDAELGYAAAIMGSAA